jgi:RecA-family ATPase
MRNPLLAAALGYAERGWPVFPCHWITNERCSCGKQTGCSPAKHPLTPDGFHGAVTDEEIIQAWWEKYPLANIGIPTGQVSGIAVVDVDNRAAWTTLKQLLPGYDFKSVPHQKTGKPDGWHLAFRHPGVHVKNGTKFLPGMDSRGDGGYIMAAPSVHMLGRQYKWNYLPANDDFPPLPPELLTAINGVQTNGNGHKPLFDTASALKGVPQGQQRVTAFKLGCKFRRVDIPFEAAQELLLKFARNCTPPLSEREALSQLADAYKRYQPADQPTEEDTNPHGTNAPLIETMEHIEEEAVDWLWDNRIARGKLSLFEGDPEIGKSYASLAIAAALSNGYALPFDREPEAPLRSLIISREDNPADTIKPRLRLLGADMGMIAIPHRDSRPSLDPNFIARVLDQWPAALVVVDPVIALAGGKNTDRASDVRELLDPLVTIASKYNTSMILIRHLNKAVGMKALYRGQGSIDFTAICRSVFTFAVDPDAPGRRLMAHTKGSLSKKNKTLEFFIEDNGRFKWGKQSDETADDALGAGESKGKREAQQFESAKKFLEEILANGPMLSDKVKEIASSRGISDRTLWRAKKEMKNIAAKKAGMTGDWFWGLRDE